MLARDLSLCMLVTNEAHQLANCLASVQELSPEIVVVDTGSTDGTRELASEWGAQVTCFDFEKVDFAAARNVGLGRAAGRWILVLDADETLNHNSIKSVRSILKTHDNIGYYLERLNVAGDSVEGNRDYAVRLFPNRPQHRYRGRVHETVDASIVAGGGKLLESQIRILHRFIPDPESRRRRNHWYIQILKEEIAADASDHSRLDFLAAEYHQLEMFDEATAIAERLAIMRPNDARAHLFAGTYHLLYKPDFRRARLDFNRALEIKPGYPEAASFLRLLDQEEAGGSQSSSLLPSAS